jgi:signal transduction histidine kinase
MVMVTHELRAPVSTIYSSLELALSGYATPEKGKEVLERAHNRANELLGLISDLLTLTRIRGQAVQREQVTPIQLADVLQEVMEFMRVEAEGKDLLLGVDVAPDLPSVYALRDQMKLVWTNLLSNAIKYTGPGGIIQVSLSQEGEQVVGVVRDTGIGIAPDDLHLVFGEFFRASNARLVSPHGTGVGLALVRRIIENWGGKVSVESELGLGSKFTFVLPRADG